MATLNSTFSGWAMVLVTIVLTSYGAVAQQAISRLRIANFMEHSPAEKLDFYLDDGAVPIASSLGFADASGAMAIDAGAHTVTAVASGAPKSAAIFVQPFVTTTDSSYTVIAARTPGDTLLGLVVSRLGSPQIADGHILIGVVDVATRLGTIHWFSGGGGGGAFANIDMWFGRTFNGHWPYSSWPEEPLKTIITRADIVADNQFADQYLGKQTITFILTGNVSDGSLALYTLRDDDTLEQRPVHKQRHPGPTDGKIRTVDLVPDLLHVNQESVVITIPSWSSNVPDFRGAFSATSNILGPVRLEVSVRTGLSQVSQLFHDTLHVGSDTLYTYFVVGTGVDSSVSSLVLTTPTNEYPTPGTSWLRVLHAGPDTGPLDIHIAFGDGSQKTITNMRFKDAGGYIEVAPGALDVQIFPAGGSTMMMEGKGMLRSDSAWTLIVDGLRKDNSLGLNLLNDNDTNYQTPMMLLSNPASVVQDQRERVGTGISISPNPARDAAVVSYSMPEPGEGTIALYDMTGRLVMSVPYGARSAASGRIRIATSGLASGMYEVVVSNGTSQARGMVAIVE